MAEASPSPEKILRDNSHELAAAIAPIVIRVLDALNAKGLIPQTFKDDTLSLRISDFEKASRIMSVMMGQLGCQPDQKQYLIGICHVLINQRDCRSETIAIDLLRQLGVPHEIDVESDTGPQMSHQSGSHIIEYELQGEDVCDELDELELEFYDLLGEVEEAFEKTEHDGLKKVKRFLLRKYNASVTNADNFNEVLNKINDFYDFIDCSLLIRMAKYLQIDDRINIKLAKHQERADNICSFATVKDLRNKLIQFHHTYHQAPDVTKNPKLHIKLPKRWYSVQIENLKLLIKRLLPENAAIDDSQSIMKHIAICNACIYIQYRVLHYTPDVLIKHAQKNEGFLRLIGVFSLVIDVWPVFENKEDKSFTFESAYQKAIEAKHEEAIEFLLPLRDIDKTYSTEIKSKPPPNTGSVVSKEIPGIERKAIEYVGIVLYENKGIEYLVTFIAIKNLEILLKHIKNVYPQSQFERGPSFYFYFKEEYIELKFDAPQDKPFTDGWTIQPHLKSSILHRYDIDEYNEANISLLPKLMISVYGSPTAVPSLHYGIPIEGVVSSVTTIYIQRERKTLPDTTYHYECLSESYIPSHYDIDSKVAHEVFKANISLIKQAEIDLSYLADKMWERRIISHGEKSRIIDKSQGDTDEQSLMDDLLHILKNAMFRDGSVFHWFAQLLEGYKTRETAKLSEKLMKEYKEIVYY